MNLWCYLIILAAIQGVAEFLPVSSSGHLAILGGLFHFREDESLTLGILLHAGSLLAICVFYFKLLIGFFRKDQFHLALMVICGTIPAGAAGVALKLSGIGEKLFGSPAMIGICFLITATLLRMTEKPKLIVRPEAERNLPPTELKQITLRQALTVGLAQMFAILPGISRSGSTIAAGILCGISREAAGSFSFLLALPAIGGAVLLELLKLLKSGGAAAGTRFSVSQLAVATIVSALVSFGALTLLMKLIRKGRLIWFSWYLYFLGIAVLIWQLVGATKG